MSKKSRIDIRVEDGIISMLNTLENQSLTQDLVQKTKSEIIIDAIKMYYLMHTNGESQSQFMDMIEIQINKIVEPFFQFQADLLDKYHANLNKNMAIYNEKVLKTLQLILMGTQLEKDESYVETLLNKNPVFVKIIDKKVEELLKERGN